MPGTTIKLTGFRPVGLGLIGAGFIALAAAAEERPVALVELISGAPDAAVEPFDYVYKNDKIDLRPGGELRLAYFNSCEVESFTGGLIKLKRDGAKATKGGVSSKGARPCQTAALSISKEAREAGVSVKRVTPFPEDEWREISIVATNPRFIWPKKSQADGEATISLYYLDADPTELVWQGSSSIHNIIYPNDAPRLELGMPYRVVVSYDGELQTSVVFSIDPHLELPDSPLTTAVPLGL